MFSYMKIYTVHLKPGLSLGEQKPVFIKEGINIAAFIFHFFWALYHRLWWVAFLVFAANVVLVFLMRSSVLTREGVVIIQLAIQVIVALQGNDWRRAKLTRKGYIMADVSAADSLLRAEQRYFERSLAA
jgi:hypothetical protein